MKGYTTAIVTGILGIFLGAIMAVIFTDATIYRKSLTGDFYIGGGKVYMIREVATPAQIMEALTGG